MGGPRDFLETDGRLTENIVHFARALRKAGIKTGSAQTESAIKAVEAAGFTRKADFYFTLRACFVNRPEQLDIFHQVFAMFWRDPEYLERMIQLMSPMLRKEEEEKKKKSAERRAAEALTEQPEPPESENEREEIQVEARMSVSETEKLRAMDFEQMSSAEAADAARLIRTLTLPLPPVRTRRNVMSSAGHRPAPRRTFRAALRRGGEIERIIRTAPRTRPMDLVALCDISGSMTSYSRMMLHFLHAMMQAEGTGWGHIHAFTFGTRLTDVTRALRHKDPDRALADAGRVAQDWQGGTRIGEALERFNKDWSRRVLSTGAAVLLITDGLERGDTALLSREAERLRLSCRRLLWLNPLLRWDGFRPEAGGVRALLPHVDGLYSCHNLDSLADLARVFGDDTVLRELRSAA